MSDLTKAILIATKMHDGQTDKGGNPYILHPLRLLMRAADNDSRIVAVLHDVIEDTSYTLADLREVGFSEEIIAAIDCLSRRENESYDEFIQRIKKNDLARIVKILDIEDNKDLSRIPNPTTKDYDRIKKFDKAIKELLS